MIRQLLLAGVVGMLGLPVHAEVLFGDEDGEGLTISAVAAAQASAFPALGSASDSRAADPLVIPRSLIPSGAAPLAPLALSSDTALAVDEFRGTTAAAVAREDIVATFGSPGDLEVRFTSQTGASSDAPLGEAWGAAGGVVTYSFFSTDNARFALDYTLAGPSFSSSFVRLENLSGPFNTVLIDLDLAGAPLAGRLQANLGGNASYRLTLFRGVNDPAVDGVALNGVGFVERTQTDVFHMGVSAVPEPAAWTLVIAGMLTVGTALRSRRCGGSGGRDQRFV